MPLIDRDELLQELQKVEVLTKLKPCPFCGGEAHLMHDGHWISCEGCQAESGYRPTRETAIEAWNRRVEENGRVH